MNNQMEFPVNFEKFAKEYGFKDDKEVYTNGIDLIPIFRVKQWLEHLSSVTPQPKTGHWIEEPNGWVRCSCCGDHYPQTSYGGAIGTKFCPNCGAKMEVE